MIDAPKGGMDFNGRSLIVHGMKTMSENVNYSFIIEHSHSAVRPAKDVNGDSTPDLLVELEDRSILLLWGGEHLSGTIDLRTIEAPAWGTRILGAQAAYGVGDLDGDGFNDIAASLPTANVNGKMLTGQVVFLFGQQHWPQEIDINKLMDGMISPVNYVIVDGVDAFGVFGSSIAGLGDIQGDGFDDVIIGAPAERLPTRAAILESPEAVYLIQGKTLYYALQNHRSRFTQGMSTN